MSKALLAIVASISLANVAHAQGKFGDVTTSTDPAKAAAVEQHVAELKTQHMSHRSGHVIRHHASHVAPSWHAGAKTAPQS
jgi:hypothetical protein